MRHPVLVFLLGACVGCGTSSSPSTSSSASASSSATASTATSGSSATSATSSSGAAGSTGTSSSGAAISNSSSSGSSTPLCPAAGAFCGSDGVQNGAPNTLYQCAAVGGRPTSSLYCATGCVVQPAGTPDACAGSLVICPGAGPYCGSDGVQNGDPNTLYQCPGADQQPSSWSACANGCSVQSAGTPDYCIDPGPICPGQGDYCGSDGVSGADPNTLYRCPGAGLAPGSSSPCANGCTAEPAGTPDLCAGTAPLCPGSGAYCAQDGVQSGVANTLYQCPGAGQPPSASQACASGCSVAANGAPDYCTGSALACPASGSFCGSDGVTGGDPNTLYQCGGAAQSPASAVACSAGCTTHSTGTSDACSITCTAAGTFCGSDGVTGGDPNTLYQCAATGSPPTSAETCSSGCSVAPAGTADSCGAACSTSAIAALAYESGKVSASESGVCSGTPPTCYSDYCLAFVNDAYTSAGDTVPGLLQYDAVAAMQAEQSSGNWTAWSGNCPCGAILFWAANTCNSSFGHVAICNGDGTVSTSGWTNYAGATNAAITWLVGEECGAEPAGYAMP